MLSFAKLAELCYFSYHSARIFDEFHTLGIVSFGIVAAGEDIVLALPGAKDTYDLRLSFVALPVKHPELGFVHSGFVKDIDLVCEFLRRKRFKNLYLIGHSLGGARARLLAAMCAVEKIPVKGICVFGSPKPGFKQYARIIQKSGMSHVSFRCGTDAATYLPNIPNLWVHTEEPCQIFCSREFSTPELIQDHSCERYVQAISESYY